jgi:hypothetical protein
VGAAAVGKGLSNSGSSSATNQSWRQRRIKADKTAGGWLLAMLLHCLDRGWPRSQMVQIAAGADRGWQRAPLMGGGSSGW